MARGFDAADVEALFMEADGTYHDGLDACVTVGKRIKGGGLVVTLTDPDDPRKVNTFAVTVKREK